MLIIRILTRQSLLPLAKPFPNLFLTFQLGLAWLSLAQLGSAWLSLAQLGSVFSGNLVGLFYVLIHLLRLRDTLWLKIEKGPSQKISTHVHNIHILHDALDFRLFMYLNTYEIILLLFCRKNNMEKCLVNLKIF